jgi:hypothetical protein
MTRFSSYLPKLNRRRLLPWLLSLVLLNITPLHAEPILALDNKSPTRVLFVGNSYFYYNDSLHNHVKRIVEELRPDLAGSLQYKSATIGGAALSHHAVDSLLTPGKLGIDEPFELVIFQGGSAEVLTDRRRKTFFEMARSHANKARSIGAEVAFYMTHAYVQPHKRAEPGMINTIASSYMTAGEQNKALVIPVGYAFELSYAMKPDLALHKHFDGSHPSLYGTYLAACVVYLSVYGGTLDDLEYTYFGEVPEDTAMHLRSVATATVNKFFKK